MTKDELIELLDCRVTRLELENAALRAALSRPPIAEALETRTTTSLASLVMGPADGSGIAAIGAASGSQYTYMGGGLR
jgi:hypothetical protein